MNHVTGARIRRRALIAGAGGLVGAALITTGMPVAQAAPAGGLNGIGLTRAEFDARYGNPLAGQGAFIYQVAGENFFVTNTSTVRTDRVVSVYWGPGGVELPEDAAQNLLARFLPDDAVLTGKGEAPAAGIGPIVRVDTYNSPSLGSALAGSGFVDSGDMLLAYSFAPGPAGLVAAANLYVAVKP